MADDEESVEEGATPGLINALGRNGVHRICAGCGFPTPRYPGRYPKACPYCGDPVPNRPPDADPGAAEVE